MTGRGVGSLLIAALLVVALTSCDDEPGRVRVVVSSAGEVVLDVDAAVAATAEERQTGLRGWPSLGPGEGLLLQFPVEGEVCLFNSGVAFDIDAIYATAAGTVAAIERSIPAGDPSARCHPGIDRVLEVNAGAAADVDIGASFDVR